MRIHVFIIILICAVSPLSILQADVIITRDNMILNGKIIEDQKPDYVIFANNHGQFAIKYNQIREIRKTENFKDDVEYLQNIGKTVNADDIKSNYESGKKKLEEKKKDSTASTDEAVSFILMSGIFFNKTFGELAPVLPYHAGIFFSTEIPVYDNRFLKALEIYGIEGGMNILYSSGKDRSINGIYITAGPLWKFPIGIAGTDFNFSALFGTGWYSVKNNETREKQSAVKMSISIHAGPSFKISTIIFSPELQIDYVYDGAAPLTGAGLSLGAGYSF